MKVIHTKTLIKSPRAVTFTGGISLRAILAEDGMGFSINKTVIPKGGPHHWHYKNHLEACYCISGEGILHNLGTGERFFIQPDMIYALDKHDDHTFEALTDVILISIFNPPLKGNETHDQYGNYK